MKIIKIDGIKGLITALFIGAGLFCGFVLAPGLGAMYLWNKYLVNLFMFPSLNLFQGVLLWAIAVTSYMIVSKGRCAVSFTNTPELSDEELSSIIHKAKLSSKMRVINKVIKPEELDLNLPKDEFSKSAESDSSFVSSPISISKSASEQASEDDTVSKIK